MLPGRRASFVPGIPRHAFLYKGALLGAEPVLLLCAEPGTAGYRGYREALRALLDAMFPGDMLTLPNETVMLWGRP